MPIQPDVEAGVKINMANEGNLTNKCKSEKGASLGAEINPTSTAFGVDIISSACYSIKTKSILLFRVPVLMTRFLCFIP